MARAMVINYGFSDIGPWSLLDQSAQSPDMIMRMMARNSVSENLQQRIDHAVKDIANNAYEQALKLVGENRGAMDKVVEVLLEKETLTGGWFDWGVCRAGGHRRVCVWSAAPAWGIGDPRRACPAWE